MSDQFPAGFDPSVYLALNPDVAAAGVDPSEHWISFGRQEGRQYIKPEVVEPKFIKETPNDQAVVDIFAGEWSGSFPVETGLVTKPGHAQLFDDQRIYWLRDHLGGLDGLSVLEIGPLEGAHSYMLQKFGARSVVAIEANQRAFLKCLCTQNVLGLDRVQFRLGDALAYLDHEPQKFDLIVASGILYHLTDPLHFLAGLMGHSDRIFIWSHYYDETGIKAGGHSRLFDAPQPLTWNGVGYDAAKRAYPDDALSWSGFSGGNAPTAYWLTKDSILRFLADGGYRTTVSFDQTDHPNGPAMCVMAEREGGQ